MGRSEGQSFGGSVVRSVGKCSTLSVCLARPSVICRPCRRWVLFASYYTSCVPYWLYPDPHSSLFPRPAPPSVSMFPHTLVSPLPSLSGSGGEGRRRPVSLSPRARDTPSPLHVTPPPSVRWSYRAERTVASETNKSAR